MKSSSVWPWFILSCGASLGAAGDVTVLVAGSDMSQRFQALNGVVIGPAWVPSGLAFEPATVKLPVSADSALHGQKSQTFRWISPLFDYRGPVQATTHWTDVDNAPPAWRTAPSICSFIDSTYSAVDEVFAAPMQDMQNKGLNYCQYLDQKRKPAWLYLTHEHVPRCRRQSLSVVRVSYTTDDGEHIPSIDEAQREGTVTGVGSHLAAALADAAVLLPSTTCARTLQWFWFSAVLFAGALWGGIGVLLRSLAQRSIEITPPEMSDFDESRTITFVDPGRSFVLVVDENQWTRQALIRDLTTFRRKVWAYGHYIDMLHDVATLPKPWIILTLTRDVPARFVQEIKEKNPHAKIICVTATLMPHLYEGPQNARPEIVLQKSAVTDVMLRSLIEEPNNIDARAPQAQTQQ